MTTPCPLHAAGAPVAVTERGERTYAQPRSWCRYCHNPVLLADMPDHWRECASDVADQIRAEEEAERAADGRRDDAVQ